MHTRPIKVLLINDDEDDYLVVRDLLSDISSIEFTLKWVSDYGAALDAMLSGEFDVGLLDYRLKERNGLEFMQEAVSRGAMTPIVFLTGRECYDLDLEAFSKEAAGWLTKGELSATLLERSISHAMERQRKIDEMIKAKRVIQALSECNHAVIHIKDEVELLRAICRIVVDVGGYRTAWVGYAEEDREHTVTPVGQYGYDKDYIETVKVTWKDAERGRGPTGTCIRTGIPSIIRSVGDQAEFAPWRAEALKRGYASVIGLPLFLDGRRLGALTIYSTETDAFDTEEAEFLVKLSGNLSYGIGVLRLRKARMQAEESLKEANLDLERRVEERTAELVKVNAELRREVEERKQAEEAVLRAKEDWERTFDAVPDLMAIIDKDYRIVRVNKAMAAMLGVTPAECIGVRCYQAVHGTSEPPSFCPHRQLIEDGIEHTAEIYEERLGRDLLVSVSPLFGPGRELIGSVHICRDITDRKHVEEALRRSQRQLADIIEFFPDATFVINNEGTVIAWNRAIEQMTGISKNEMIGKGDFEYSLPFFASRRPILIDLVFASEEKKMQYHDSFATVGGAVVAETYAPEAYGGKGAYLWGVATALFDEQGNVTGAIESIRDITERKLAEIALRESEERFSRFFRASPVGTSITRLSDGQIVDANDAFLRLFGYTREELIGHNPLDLGMWANPENRQSMVEILKEQGRIRDIETQVRRKSGEIIDVLGFAEMIEIAGQQYILSLAYEITERKRAKAEKEKLEAQLLQAQKMESVGRLAGGVAHDFNNMLGVIIGRAELALNTEVSADQLQHNLQEILKAGLRSADLTRQLLAFARKQTAVPRILDLNDTIPGMLKMLRRLIGEDIDLIWVPELDLWKVKIDPSQVDQILANLAVNARDAISGVGAITMRSQNVVIDDSDRTKPPEFIPGEYVLLTVSDTGAGMSKEVRENIFEPFFTTKEVGKGTGLGLSTVYGIVKQNDGFIYVASEPGKGATFKIYLPRFVAETAQVPPEETAGKPPAGTETILLVEDDEAILNLSKMILENLGYTVLAAQTPVDAIRLAEEHPADIHLLITDVVMPEMNGRELAERLGAIRPNLKCLYMSGYTADVIAHRGILDEGVNFIRKPFLSDDFAARVRQVLDHLE